MLSSGVREPFQSPWASQVVLVHKKVGTIPYCINYRKLNAVTVKDSYPLPRIDESLDSLGGAKFVSTFDLASRYRQIGLSDDTKAKSAICTTSVLFQFKVMPFGRCNTLVTFQRLMEKVLGSLCWQVCLVNIDDVIVFNVALCTHLSSIAQILSRLGDAGMRLKPWKCHLLQTSVSFLGHVVSAEGVSKDLEKVKAM